MNTETEKLDSGCARLAHQDGVVYAGGNGGDRLLDVSTVAEILSCSERTVWRWRDEGWLPKSITIKRVVRWSRKAIMAWIDAGCPRTRAEGRV
ncbi:MAG: helix-turn-helix domain-containing protein [Verrucomicrobia bacterium]|jgi:predicted DNA-binding transcriptional regulator AlpA|nr:helix-turn-helix domain-containing protein [Verrucomicrobiota bacterium]MBT7069033.1 helix-turn-helix domain-containing protein [Verrucomicrobiota bacterium]MBT7699722.1 helix-turn-helix domain-containing protein [Verrucomicrobiota bacterium]